MRGLVRELAIGATLGMLLGAPPARAQTLSPFSEFAKLAKGDLATLQGKLTWVGPQEEMLQIIAFTAPGQAFDLSKFVPFRRPGVNYVNEKMPPRTFTATTDQLAALLKNVGALPAVAAGGVQPNGVLSFALEHGGKVFEVILARADAVALMTAVMSALESNATALQLLGDLGCAGGVLGTTTASEVTSSVTITRGGVRRSRATGRYLETVTVQNTSGGKLAAPISIIMAGLPGSVTVATKAGTTCNITPAGLPFVNVDGPLAPRNSADLTVEFDNPDGLTITYSTRVFAGPGPR